MNLKILAPAKINLGLEIGQKNAQGYHKVDMIMQSISLCDEIDLSFCSAQKIEIETDKCIDCPTEKNIAYRAAQEFFKFTKIKNSGVKIKIKKNIPMRAGLAGGSADGAGVIVGLNKMFETNLDISQMCKVGSKVGSDVPFCIVGGTAVAKGIGTELTPINTMPDCVILLVKPGISVSTEEAYHRFDQIKKVKNHNMNLLESALKTQDLMSMCSNLYNRFEDVINNEEIFKIKETMKKSSALGSLMTGSGSAVYGVFNDMNKAEECLKIFRNMYDFACITRPLNHGAFLI